ncbi:MAG: hypothetical protein KDE58_23090, partial [Caldilineaceae bacterium]|nr:hypothetical protein [Caldilineaceae bacterium]
MKRMLLTTLLSSLLFNGALAADAWGSTTQTALAQESTTAQLPEPTLYMPSNVQQAYANGTRSPDGTVSESY